MPDYQTTRKIEFEGVCAVQLEVRVDTEAGEQLRGQISVELDGVQPAAAAD